MSQRVYRVPKRVTDQVLDAIERKERERMNVMEKLKGLNLDRMEFEEALELYSLATLINGTYIEFAAEAPEWLTEARDSLKKHIRERRKDAIARELKLTEAALDGLKTAQEKRDELRAKKERLQAQLA